MQTRFTENDFTGLLLREFQKRGIYHFRKYALEKELYYYANNLKYKPLYLDIDCRYNQVHLDESFGYLYMFGGMFSPDNLDFDLKYICPDVIYYNSKEELKDYEALMVEMINEYFIRKNVTSESIINLSIHDLNPNIQYNLVRGTRLNEVIEWNLVTDGDIDIVRYEVYDEIKHVFWPYPHIRNNGDMSKLDDVSATCIKVNNATYAIRQGKLNNEVVTAEILTEILDEEILCELAKLAMLDESVEKPSVRVLKQS